MSKKWMAVAGVVVLVAIVLAVAIGLTSRKTPSSNSPGVVTTTGPTPSTAGTGTSVKPGQVAPTAPTTSSTAPSKTTTSGGTAKTGSSSLKPFPPLPASGLPAHAATSPAAPGEKLAPLTDAPNPTISGLRLSAIPNGSQYKIRMRPYGIGPSLLLGSRLAIHVDSVTPVSPAPVESAIMNANVLALVDTTHGGTVTQGGTYTATLTFRSDGTKLLPVLSKATAVK